MSKYRKKSILMLSLICFLYFLSGMLANSENSILRVEEETKSLTLLQENPVNEWFSEEREKQIIQDSGFDDKSSWEILKEGDTIDLDCDVANGTGNFKLLGETQEFQALEGKINNQTSPFWYNSTNSDIPEYPTKGHEIRDTGLYSSHLWDEHANTLYNPHQRAAIQWDRLITTPVNMSDYQIIDANLEVLVNATVRSYRGDGTDADGGWGGIETFGDEYDENSFAEGDYIRYYVMISNPSKTTSYEATQLRPEGLGYDGNSPVNGTYDYLNDTVFAADNKEDLIFYLEQVLKYNQKEFVLSLGVEFYSEDNQVTDLDFFEHVLIKSCNFSFTFQKVMDQNSLITLRYTAEKLDDEGGRIEIRDATFNFDYMIDKIMAKKISPNSEIKIQINGKALTQTLKIFETPQDLAQASEEHFQVKNLFLGGEDNSVAIQINLADTFSLGEEYRIKVDNALLEVKYTIYLSEEESILYQVLLVLVSIAAVSLIGYLIYYQKVLRYPKPIRKVRKVKKALNKKSFPDIKINTRNAQLKGTYSRKAGNLYRPKNRKKISSKDIKKNQREKKVNIQVLFLILFLIFGIFLVPMKFKDVNFQRNRSEANEINLIIGQESRLIYSSEQSFEKNWIENSNFNNRDGWDKILTGDTRDFISDIKEGTIKTTILGKKGTIKWNETNPIDSGGWFLKDNENGIPKTDNYTMSSQGWNIDYEWPDNRLQLRIVEWQKNFTTNLNMSDYIITSASLSAIINGTVQGRDVEGGGIDRPGDTYTSGTSTVDIATGDYAQYYIKISDIEKNREFEVAKYQTDDLGKDIEPDGAIDTLNDTLITPLSEETLIFYLNEILKYDYYNFSLTVGISLWCEDSGQPGDTDDWQDLWIKNLTLSMEYAKKIDQLSTISWIYDGEQISSGNNIVEIKNALVNFEYNLNNSQLQKLTPNSGIKIFINGIEHVEAVNLIDAKTFLSSASKIGYNVTQLIPIDEEINLKLQIALQDEFQLGEAINVQIDNVQLIITYLLIKPDQNALLYQTLLILGLISLAGIGSYIIFYRKVLRFPKMIRLVRKFKKSLTKHKTLTDSINSRRVTFLREYNAEIPLDYRKGIKK